jgi:hypothetical protein
MGANGRERESCFLASAGVQDECTWYVYVCVVKKMMTMRKHAFEVATAV